MTSAVHTISSDSEEEEVLDLASRIQRKFYGKPKVTEVTPVEDEKKESEPTECLSLDSDSTDDGILEVKSCSSTNITANCMTSKMKEQKTEAARLKEEKRKEREMKKLEKERIKLEKQQLRAQKKATRPGECIKYVIVYIDRHLLERCEGSEIISRLSMNGIQYKITDHEVPLSLTFYRQDPVSLEESSESEAVILIPVDDFIPLIYSQIYGSSETCGPTICEMCKSWKVTLGTNVTFVVCGLDDYYKKQKTIGKRNFRQQLDKGRNMAKKRKKEFGDEQLCVQVNRVDVETALVATQIEENVNHRIFATPSRVADFVFQIVKAIAEKPYKQEKQSSSSQFGWYAEGSSTNCVKVDKSGVGLLKLWHQQLRQFNNVGIEVAQAIAKEYPSPQLLWKAYDSLPEDKGALLLADIPVRRGQGVLASIRRVGPELSKKIYTFMTSKDPLQSIGHKT